MQRQARNTQGPPGARGLLRAALLGLSGGLLLGGLFLAVTGLVTRFKPADCVELSEEECTFMRDTAREMGRVQGLSGAALLALGLATAVLVLRPKSPSSAERPG
ncbi:hypothetical protein CYFUS_002070 [Cystobacter fuscus]|uniref:Uncharacterized protein n=1 Tax=Cystobacter fuscus TaxID=43 RepID=A0A250IY36_9BACT|nr:hypothetical protein [Cystobacter fuscus]ATB36655.1 hypothetical protein CYFUS_002070 [Cystobacter fuscus]